MAMLSGCALAHAEKPFDAFFPVKPYTLRLTDVCWNPVLRFASTVRRICPGRPAPSGRQ
jgi:hypothetical protein